MSCILNSHSHIRESESDSGIYTGHHVIQQESVQKDPLNRIKQQSKSNNEKNGEVAKLYFCHHFRKYCQNLINEVKSGTRTIKQIIKESVEIYSLNYLTEKITDKEKVGNYVNFGFLYFKGFKFEAAFAYLEKAEQNFDQLDNTKPNAYYKRRVYHMKARILLESGNSKGAFDYIEKEREINNNRFPQDKLLRTLNNFNLARYHCSIKEDRKAKVILEKTLKNYIQPTQVILETTCYVLLAQVAINQKHFEKAKARLNQGLKLLEDKKEDDPIKGLCYCLLGDICLLKKKDADARRKYEKGLQELSKFLPEDNVISTKYLKYLKYFDKFREDSDISIKEVVEAIAVPKDKVSIENIESFLTLETSNKSFQESISVSSIQTSLFNRQGSHSTLKPTLVSTRLDVENKEEFKEIRQKIFEEIKGIENELGNGKNLENRQNFAKQKLLIYIEIARISQEFGIPYKVWRRRAKKSFPQSQKWLQKVRDNPQEVLETLTSKNALSLKELLDLLAISCPNLEESKRYLNTSLEINERFNFGSDFYKAQTLAIRGRLYIHRQDKWKDAEKDLRAALELNTEDNKFIIQTCFSLIELFLTKNNMKSAQRYIKKVKHLIDKKDQNLFYLRAILDNFKREIHRYTKTPEAKLTYEKVITILKRGLKEDGN